MINLLRKTAIVLGLLSIPLAQAQDFNNGGGFNFPPQPSSSGGAPLTVTDGTNSVTNTTSITTGANLAVGGAAGAATVTTSVPDSTTTISAAIAAANMGGLVNYNGSSITATFPAISSTVMAAAMSTVITNRHSSNLTVATTPTINGCASSTTLYQYGFMAFVSNGTSLDCFGFPGFGIVSGDLTISATGTGTLASSGVTAAAYTHPDVTFDAKGRATAAINGTLMAKSTSELDCDNSGSLCGAAGTTLTNVTGLSVSLLTGRTYYCHIALMTSAGSSGGLKVALAATDTLTVSAFALGGYLGQSAGQNTTSLGTGIGGTASQAFASLDATLVTTAAGTLQVQAAQNASNATQTKVLVNSHIVCHT